jgi:hypothetical protein
LEVDDTVVSGLQKSLKHSLRPSSRSSTVDATAAARPQSVYAILEYFFNEVYILSIANIEPLEALLQAIDHFLRFRFKIIAG